MFSVEVTSEGLDDLMREVRDLAEFRPRLEPARGRVVEAVRRANDEARAAGLDKDGRRLADPAPATMADPRRGGDGPALAPRREGSRSAASVIVDAEPTARGMAIGIGWVGQPWLTAHAEGRGRSGPVPVRDILGVPPGAVEAADAIILPEIDAQVIDTMRRRRS